MKGLWCKKIGMTQLFQENGVVVPVTVVDTGRWVVTQIKSVDRDGYAAVQVGCVHERYADVAFDAAWLKSKSRYFSVLREVPAIAEINVEVGSVVDASAVLTQGELVDVGGATIGRGFQGGVKRHGFSGGRGSHGDKLGRKPGSMGFMRSRGRVIKGWRMAGHMGCNWHTVKGIKVVAIDANRRAVMIKGAVPGKSGALLFMCRQVVGK